VHLLKSANIESLYNDDIRVSFLAAPNVYSFPVFTGAFCRHLMEELEHFEQSEVPKGRPNTMNKGGVS
jgi:hypothetical protein